MALSEAADYRRFQSSKDEVEFSIGSPEFGTAEISSIILAYMDEEIPNDIDELRNLLRHELENNLAYGMAWKSAEELFNEYRIKEKYTTLRREGIHTEYHIALICYVLNSIYQQFNEDTRNVKTSSDFENYNWKSLFKFLSLACDELFGYPEVYPKDLTVYRGFSGTHSDAEIEKRVVFQNFISATQDVEIAQGYAVKYDQAPTVFVFKGFIPRAIGLEHHLSEHNKEILLSPYNSYIIKNIFSKEGVRYICLETEDNSVESDSSDSLTDSHSEDDL